MRSDPFLPSGDAFPECRDPASVLVTQRKGSCDTDAFVQHVQIGMTYSGSCNTHQHLTRRRCRLRQIDNLGRTSNFQEANSFHSDVSVLRRDTLA